MQSEGARIRAQLSAQTGAASVTRGWPRGEAALPCIAVSKAADAPADFRDGRAYAALMEYDVRVFSRSAGEADSLAQEAEAAMQALGYVRVLGYDSDDAGVRMAMLRYRRYG